MQRENPPKQNEAKTSPNNSPSPSQNQSFSVSPSKTGEGDSDHVTSDLPESLSKFPVSSPVCNQENHVITTENRLYLAKLTLQYQDMLERYSLCFSHLQEAIRENEVLRLENTTIKSEIDEMKLRLNFILGLGFAHQHQNQIIPTDYSPMSIVSDFQHFPLGNVGGFFDGRNTCGLQIDHQKLESPLLDRVSLPKSISVRSSGFLKTVTGGGSKANVSCSRINRNRVANLSSIGSQRVYIPGDSGKEDAVELEVYNQGMFKTELCNKWQEMGMCPYGDHCQFAHGLDELRPVIRHPRYKTEVCRMILAGEICPYGHRCHFRHALNDQDHATRLNSS